jgi:hypothetical protein
MFILYHQISLNLEVLESRRQDGFGSKYPILRFTFELVHQCFRKTVFPFLFYLPKSYSCVLSSVRIVRLVEIERAVVSFLFWHNALFVSVSHYSIPRSLGKGR